jgi:SAM-dependent methyltransferase
MPHVEFYESSEGVEQYAGMAEGHDGSEHIPVLRELLAAGSTVLEVGIGPGSDLAMLAETFSVTGSDNSQAFIDRFAAAHPDTEVIRLDAVTLDVESRFDGIYSNKVLHHLDDDELRASLERQSKVLVDGGLAMHTIWKGDGIEDYEGMFVQNRDCDSFMALAPAGVELIECTPYAEFDEGDSLRIVIRNGSSR